MVSYRGLRSTGVGSRRSTRVRPPATLSVALTVWFASCLPRADYTTSLPQLAARATTRDLAPQMAHAQAIEPPVAPDIDYTEIAARKRAARCRFDRDEFHLPTTSDAPIVTVTIPQQGWQAWSWPMLSLYPDGEVLANRRHCVAHRCTDTLMRYQVSPAAAQQLRAALRSRLRGLQHALTPGYYASEGQATQIFIREGAIWRVYSAYGWFSGEFLDTVAAHTVSPRVPAATPAHRVAPSLRVHYLPEPEPPPLAFAQAFATAKAFTESLANAVGPPIESVSEPHIGPTAEPHIGPAAFTMVLHALAGTVAVEISPWPDARDHVYRIGTRNVMLTLVPHYRGQAWVRTAQICADQRGWLARY